MTLKPACVRPCPSEGSPVLWTTCQNGHYHWDLLQCACWHCHLLYGMVWENSDVSSCHYLHALATLLNLGTAGLPKVRLRQALLQALEHTALPCKQNSAHHLPENGAETPWKASGSVQNEAAAVCFCVNRLCHGVTLPHRKTRTLSDP